MKMKQDKLATALRIVNTRPLLRFLVCIAPGVMLSQLTLKLGMPDPVRVFATVWTLGGAVLFIAWPTLYNRLFVLEADVPTVADDKNGQVEPMSGLSQPPAPGMAEASADIHSKLMLELLAMCSGDAQRMLRVISEECTLNPHESYLTAIMRAHHRQKLLLNSPTENLS